MRLSKRSLLFLTLLALVAIPAAASDQPAAPAQAPVATALPQLGGCPSAAPAEVAAAPAEDPVPVCSADDPQPGAALFIEPIEQKGPPSRRGYCKCGCGITCETDADCGPGGSCVGFVTCC